MSDQLRDLRMHRQKALVIFRRRVIDRKLTSIDGMNILVKNAPYDIASKLLGWINLELYFNDKWNIVNFKDFETLKKLYQPQAKVEAPKPVVEKSIPIKEKITMLPISPKEEPKVEENIILQDHIMMSEDFNFDDIQEESEMLEIPNEEKTNQPFKHKRRH